MWRENGHGKSARAVIFRDAPAFAGMAKIGI
jgi:hypothetical protein